MSQEFKLLVFVLAGLIAHVNPNSALQISSECFIEIPFLFPEKGGLRIHEQHALLRETVRNVNGIFSAIFPDFPTIRPITCRSDIYIAEWYSDDLIGRILNEAPSTNEFRFGVHVLPIQPKNTDGDPEILIYTREKASEKILDPINWKPIRVSNAIIPTDGIHEKRFEELIFASILRLMEHLSSTHWPLQDWGQLERYTNVHSTLYTKNFNGKMVLTPFGQDVLYMFERISYHFLSCPNDKLSMSTYLKYPDMFDKKAKFFCSNIPFFQPELYLISNDAATTESLVDTEPNLNPLSALPTEAEETFTGIHDFYPEALAVVVCFVVLFVLFCLVHFSDRFPRWGSAQKQSVEPDMELAEAN